jgi:hypothetical protein
MKCNFQAKKERKVMSKLRVWWIPQVGMDNTFYIPVKTVEEGKKILDTLAAYDLFQLNNRIKPDFSNTGGLQILDEEEDEWNDWFYESDSDYFEDVDEYCESDICETRDTIAEETREIFEQLK